MTAAAIVEALGGRWHGAYGLAQCVAHKDGATPALKISDDPRKSDGIDVKCFAGCDWRAVKAELRRLNLLSAPLFPDTTEIVAETLTKPTSGAHPNGTAAAAMWKAAAAANALIGAYLRGRGYTGEIPTALRYIANAKHRPSGRAFPCMLAAVPVWPSRTVGAVHRTFLAADGDGKAQVSPDRMMLGSCAGGAVRLAPVATEMGLAEGVETGLSAMQMTGVPTWSTLSTTGLQTVVLPRDARTIVIFADNDANGAGQKAAEALASRLAREGRKIRIEYPPDSHKDWNDALRAGAA